MPWAEADRRHWRSNRRLTVVLLLAWAAITFGLTFFARDLTARMAGWPFSFWLAGQGAPIAYLLMTGCYSRLMDRADAKRRTDAGG